MRKLIGRGCRKAEKRDQVEPCPLIAEKDGYKYENVLLKFKRHLKQIYQAFISLQVDKILQADLFILDHRLRPTEDL
jgi:hypothetical protein